MIDFSNKEIAFIVETVRRAARLARKVQQEMVLEGVEKDDLSPVTVGDYAIQAVVAKALKDAFPGDGLVGEENAEALRKPENAAMLDAVTRFVAEEEPGATPEAVCEWIDAGAAEPSERFWTLDPIDGTKGYLRGEHYAVAFALIERGEVVLGALGCPALQAEAQTATPGAGAIIVARRECGAWAAPLDGDDDGWNRLQVSDQDEATHARILRSVEKAHTNMDDTDRIAAHLGIKADPVGMDSQAKYAVLAAGGAEILLRLLSPKQPDYKEKIWDQAAGSIILEEAGGMITDLLGRPLDFSQGRSLANNTGVFASNKLLHDRGIEAIAAVCDLG